MRALIDTCVVIDVLQAREPFAKDAQTVFLLAANEQFNACITAKSVTDIYYLTHRFTHSDMKTREILNKLFSLFKVLDTAGSDCLHAIPSPISDFEDAVMVETAKRCGIDCVITRNGEDFKDSGIPIFSPQDFIQALESEET